MGGRKELIKWIGLEIRHLKISINLIIKKGSVLISLTKLRYFLKKYLYFKYISRYLPYPPPYSLIDSSGLNNIFLMT